jgi:hypothetical protein
MYFCAVFVEFDVKKIFWQIKKLTYLCAAKIPRERVNALNKNEGYFYARMEGNRFVSVPLCVSCNGAQNSL